ncbi:hypothetical protein R1sor_000891 [Riccia sorocarpa]|uniref:Uncharacterized protein n=1 Tax=Riccia sorocarpa TaxID=122646 RepID=A0ABD3GYE4_9MARC
MKITDLLQSLADRRGGLQQTALSRSRGPELAVTHGVAIDEDKERGHNKLIAEADKQIIRRGLRWASPI